MADEWEDGHTAETPAFRVRPIDFAIVGVNYVKSLLDAHSELLGGVRYLLIGKANRETQQLDFQENARLQIEQITQEQETPETDG